MEIKYEPFRHVWYVEKDGIICYVPEFAVEYIKGVESENAKLLECLQDFADVIKNDDGSGVDQGWMLERMRELGIEADS